LKERRAASRTALRKIEGDSFATEARRRKTTNLGDVHGHWSIVAKKRTSSLNGWAAVEP
jgi:hypothetical protein